MRQFRLLVCVLSCLLLVACSSSQAPQPKPMPQTPYLTPALPHDETAQTGTMVVSFSCNLPSYRNQEITIPFARKSGVKLRLFEPMVALKAQCKRGRQLIVEQLPPGTYRLHKWDLPVLAATEHMSETRASTESLTPPFYFSVKPGITTYVGRLSLSQQEVAVEDAGKQAHEEEAEPKEPSYTYHILMSQKYSKSDIARFKKRYKHLAQMPLRKASL